MDQTLDAGCYTVLQLMLARGLFIGDELRIATLRTSWSESGQPAESFGVALHQLKDHALIKLGHSKAGPVAQLTKHGFALGQKPRHAPEAERRQAPPAGQKPPHRRRKVEDISPANNTTPTPTPPRRAASPQTNNKVTHGDVFSSNTSSPSAGVLQMCVLGLLRNHRIPANGQLDYSCVLHDWKLMKLPQDDLLLAIKRLCEHGDIETLSHPSERLLLTTQGYTRYESTPTDMDAGKNRWEAKKLLRATKRLGTLPAA